MSRKGSIALMLDDYGFDSLPSRLKCIGFGLCTMCVCTGRWRKSRGGCSHSTDPGCCFDQTTCHHHPSPHSQHFLRPPIRIVST
ncbi:hypothetical protein KC360_g87 [Hortaea werneckii]|nr:hypothetical protein KC360_g87 [Hortaea werneckii]